MHPELDENQVGDKDSKQRSINLKCILQSSKEGKGRSLLHPHKLGPAALVSLTETSTIISLSY